LVAAYRELVRLHSQLSDEAARYQNEIHALLVVQFPEFSQVFADPCRPTALAVLKRYPSPQAMLKAGVETLAKLFHELSPSHYGRATAEQLVAVAQHSVSSGLAVSARSSSVRILCDQLAHTQANLATLAKEIEQLISSDPKAKGRPRVQEFGVKTVAVLRAELGDVDRFSRVDQAVAYAGLDLEVKESGKWRGQTKLSKRGSGRLRRILYPGLAPQRPFGRIGLWGLLSPSGGTWDEKGQGLDGGHEENADCGGSLDQNRGVV